MEEFSKQMLEIVKQQNERQLLLQQQQLEQQLLLQQQQQKLEEKLADRQFQQQQRMEESFLDLKKLQLEHQVKTEERIELLTRAIGNGKDDTQITFSQSEILSAMDIFIYNVEGKLTFEEYYRRYDQKKLRLLSR